MILFSDSRKRARKLSTGLKKVCRFYRETRLTPITGLADPLISPRQPFVCSLTNHRFTGLAADLPHKIEYMCLLRFLGDLFNLRILFLLL